MIKSILHKDGIAIDITNHCIHSCSNCMRMCNLNQPKFFMDLEYFKTIIKHLYDIKYKGIIGIIGGEPLLHPQFEEICKCLQQYFPKQHKFFKKPIKNFNQYLLEHNIFDDGTIRLFSCVPNSYYKYFETIDDTFDSLRLNDHNNNTKHCTVMASYKDLNIDDDMFNRNEEDCWVQEYCFANITPKGVYFCEMAGVIDWLLDGNRGWDIHSDWINYTKKDYAKQRELCKYCGGRIPLPMTVDKDIYSYVTKFYIQYLPDNFYYKEIKTKEFWKNCYQWQKIKQAKLSNVADEIGVSDTTNIQPKRFNKSNVVSYEFIDWVIINDDDNKLYHKLYNHILNPGCLYILDKAYAYNVNAKALADKPKDNLPLYYPLNKIIDCFYDYTEFDNIHTQNEKEIKVTAIENIKRRLNDD